MKNLFLLIFVLLFLSCNDDDSDKERPQSSLSITWGQNPNNWIFLSDDSGKIIASKNFTDVGDFIFNYQGEGDDNHCNLTVLTNVGGFFLKTYSKVSPGDYNLNYQPEINNTGTTKIGQHILTLDESFLSKFVYNPQGYCGYSAEQNNKQTTVKIDICSEVKSYVYAWIQSYSQPPRYVFKEMKVSEKTELSFDGYDQLTEMERKQIPIPDNVSINLNVEGRNIFPYSNNMIYFDFSKNQSKEVTVYYVNLPQYFLEYMVDFSYYYENDPNVTYGFTKRSNEVDVSFSSIDASLEKTISKTTNKLSYQFSGSADYVYSYLSKQVNGTGVVWEVYTPFSSNTEINLPQFTSEILSKVDLSAFKDLDFNWVSVVNNNDPNQDSYSLFLNTQLKFATGSRVSKNIAQKSYGF